MHHWGCFYHFSPFWRSPHFASKYGKQRFISSSLPLLTWKVTSLLTAFQVWAGHWTSLAPGFPGCWSAGSCHRKPQRTRLQISIWKTEDLSKSLHQHPLISHHTSQGRCCLEANLFFIVSNFPIQITSAVFPLYQMIYSHSLQTPANTEQVRFALLLNLKPPLSLWTCCIVRCEDKAAPTGSLQLQLPIQPL